MIELPAVISGLAVKVTHANGANFTSWLTSRRVRPNWIWSTRLVRITFSVITARWKVRSTNADIGFSVITFSLSALVFEKARSSSLKPCNEDIWFMSADWWGEFIVELRVLYWLRVAHELQPRVYPSEISIWNVAYHTSWTVTAFGLYVIYSSVLCRLYQKTLVSHADITLVAWNLWAREGCST